MIRIFPALFLIGAPIAGVAQSAERQSAPLLENSRHVVQRADSVAARRAAMSAQRRFEQTRRHTMRVQYTGNDHVCDARIGRYCQWNDDNAVLPDDPAPVNKARQALLDALERVAALSPNDGWITGQRVRYLIEARRDTAAVMVAQSCTGAAWWCHGLRGLALHEAKAGTSADSAFALALASMPAAERCRWTDITVLLTPAQRKRYGKIGCGRNDALVSRIWWLADPLHSIPGNQRQAEHYSRHMMNLLLESGPTGYGTSWANDLRELVVRYGWVRVWTRPTATSTDPFANSNSGHEASPSGRFLPDVARLDSLTSIGDSGWSVRARPSVERYSLALAPRFTQIDAQIARFRRGDSALVVAAYDVSQDTTWAAATISAALVLSRDASAAAQIVGPRTQTTWSTAFFDGSPHLLSLEVFDFAKGRGAFHREVVSLPKATENQVTVSDLLLFDPTSVQGDDTDDLFPKALGSLSVPRSRKLGLYWEIYGLARADSALPLSLTLTRTGEGALSRLARSIGLGAASTPMTIRWRESPGAGAVTSRSVSLDLERIPRGKYVLRMELKPAGRQAVATSRVIQLR
ncbi:MAG TPA: hypothetical protein VM939_10995 [Gemmatimonadaceae bacterium]|nr:hypothetical protein [Gemmatimonadaceae bacterium]